MHVQVHVKRIVSERVLEVGCGAECRFCLFNRAIIRSEGVLRDAHRLLAEKTIAITRPKESRVVVQFQKFKCSSYKCVSCMLSSLRVVLGG